MLLILTTVLLLLLVLQRCLFWPFFLILLQMPRRKKQQPVLTTTLQPPTPCTPLPLPFPTDMLLPPTRDSNRRRHMTRQPRKPTELSFLCFFQSLHSQLNWWFLHLVAVLSKIFQTSGSLSVLMHNSFFPKYLKPAKLLSAPLLGSFPPRSWSLLRTNWTLPAVVQFCLALKSDQVGVNVLIRLQN